MTDYTDYTRRGVLFLGLGAVLSACVKPYGSPSAMSGSFTTAAQGLVQADADYRRQHGVGLIDTIEAQSNWTRDTLFQAMDVADRTQGDAVIRILSGNDGTNKVVVYADRGARALRRSYSGGSIDYDQYLTGPEFLPSGRPFNSPNLFRVDSRPGRIDAFIRGPIR